METISVNTVLIRQKSRHNLDRFLHLMKEIILCQVCQILEVEVGAEGEQKVATNSTQHLMVQV